MVQLGLEDNLKESIDPWLCYYCGDCSLTCPKEAEPGTIRADFADSIEENIVHGSDAADTAAREISFFFSETEICPRTR